ncbi:MAG: YfbK domain-containing protein, partial [Planctomycetota bacterium]
PAPSAPAERALPRAAAEDLLAGASADRWVERCRKGDANRAGAIESEEKFKADDATEELRARDQRFLSESDFADSEGEEETSASAAEVEEEDEDALGLRMEGDTDFGGDGLLWEYLAEASEYALGATRRTLGYAEKLLPPQSRLADKGGAVSDGAKSSAGLAPRLGDLERRLRAFAHYRALDPSLSFETFAARDLRVPPPAIGDEGLGAEGFRRRYGVHPFVETRLDRFSTFGMDVDTASWSLAVAHLRAGKLPPPKAVRVEEFVNSFGEDIPVDPEEVFAFAAEGGPSPFGEGLDLLKIAVKARELREGERKDAVLTFLIDTSGSMAAALSSGIEKEPSGRASRKAVEGASRLEAVQGALAALLESLSSEDRVQIVAYATTPYLVLPLTPAREAERIVGAVRSIQPSGATNLEAGLDLAYRVADEAFNPRAVNRVILASDGAANLGARDPEEILKRVEVFARRGIYLSALGFGLGKYDDAMLETLADRGNGNYAHVDSPERAREILRANLPRTLQVLAADAKIQVEFDPEVVTHYRLLGYENRDIRDEDFRNDKVDAGEVGPGSTVTVLYEIRRKAAATGNLGRIFVRYRDVGTGRVEERDYPLSPGVLATRLEETTDRFRFVASVAELAELLRGSYWARDGSYAKVLEVLGGLSPEFRATAAWREVAEAALRAQALTVRELAGR